MKLRIKRVYDPATDDDGFRVLVDRLWPRGVKRENAALDEWAKDIAPTPDLRTWWNHDPDRQEEFAARYLAELDDNPAVEEFRTLIADHPTVTLLYGARDPQVNHAAILRDHLEAEQV